MPTPGLIPDTTPSPEIRDFLRRLNRTTETTLAEEVAELRREIAALRDELAPVPSLILTGREVLAEFKRLVRTQAAG